MGKRVDRDKDLWGAYQTNNSRPESLSKPEFLKRNPQNERGGGPQLKRIKLIHNKNKPGQKSSQKAGEGQGEKGPPRDGTPVKKSQQQQTTGSSPKKSRKLWGDVLTSSS